MNHPNKTLRLLAAALCFAALALLAFAPSAAASTVTVQANAINSTRGSGQLIIFTSDYGEKTATNEWGSEAVVGADHKVTAVGGNNSTIPAGGFVLSGHDSDDGLKMKTWINNNVKVGQYLYYDERTLVVTVSDDPIDVPAEVFYEVSADISGVNVARLENYLVIFTSGRGASTGTNEYGYEVIVTSGLITDLGGNDSRIPSGENSFVVSGHGTAADWLRANAVIGMGCRYDKEKKTVTFVYDAQSIENGLNYAIKKAKKECEEAKKMFLYMDYDAFEKTIAEAEKKLAEAVKAFKKDQNESKYASAAREVEALINASEVAESYPVQYRGAWLRPSQKSAEEVDAYVEKLYQAGINTVCVEGIFSNTVIMYVPDGCLFEHNPSFGYDVLQAYIDACHKRGMECHLWMSIFNIGTVGSSGYTRSVGYKKPEWLSKDETGNADNVNHFAMLDPANEEARAYQLSFYEYLIKTYDIDCFELDYIRYHVRTEHDYGYTEAAMEGFKKKYGYTENPAFDTKAAYWNDWVQYRKDSVSEMVRSVREMIDRVNPEVLIAADVVANPDEAGVSNYQDYLRWEKEGWLDLLHPMAYGDGFDEAIKKQVSLGGDRCAVAVGLGVYMDSLGASDMVRQAIRDNELGTYGDVYFEASAYLLDKAGEALLQNVYRTQAMPPFLDRDASIKACLAYLDGHINDVILPLGGVTQEEADAVLAASKAAAESVKDAKMSSEALSSLRSAINAVHANLAKKALNADLYRAERISCVTYRVDRSELEKDPEKPQPSEESGEESGSESSSGEESGSGTESVQESEAASGEASGEESKAGEQKSRIPVWVWIVGGSVLLMAAAVAIALVKRKK